MELKLKVYIVDDQGRKFMGIGVLWLLEHIRSFGSLRKAAEAMGISYTKAHGMLNALEEGLGKQVVLRRRGGDSREGTMLTPLGLSLVARYANFHKKLKDDAAQSFQQFLSGLEEETNEQE